MMTDERVFVNSAGDAPVGADRANQGDIPAAERGIAQFGADEAGADQIEGFKKCRGETSGERGARQINGARSGITARDPLQRLGSNFAGNTRRTGKGSRSRARDRDYRVDVGIWAVTPSESRADEKAARDERARARARRAETSPREGDEDEENYHGVAERLGGGPSIFPRRRAIRPRRRREDGIEGRL